MGGVFFWKNKLISFIKNHRLEFPMMKITAIVECEVTVNGEKLQFTMPIVLSKDTKKHARELMYGEVYDGLLEYFNEKEKDDRKNKKETDKRRTKKSIERMNEVDKEEIDNKRLVKSTGKSRRKSMYCASREESKEKKERVSRETAEIKFKEIEESNIGFKILEKLGWVKGEGLNGGMTEPIPVVMRKKNSGLGS